MRLSKARKEIVTAMMKDTIVEAAGSVLEQHGVGGMTMDRVATTAGLTAGSLYNYFRNKEELLQFIFARLTDPLLQSFEETLKSDLLAPQKLEAILRTVLERSSQDKGLIRLLAESGQDRHIKRTVRPRVLKILTRVFEQGAAEGSFRRHNAAHMGRLFQGCLSEVYEMQVEGASSDDVDAYVAVLIDTVRNGFCIHAGGRTEEN